MSAVTQDEQGMAGPTAPNDKRLVAFGHVVDANAAKTGRTVDSLTGTQAELRDSKTGRFVKGHAPLAGAGRPKKGERLLDYTRKLVEGKAANLQAVAEAKLDRLLNRGAVGNRAWAEYRDTYYGLPKQAFVVETQDSPMAQLLVTLHGYGALPQPQPSIIDGEVRELAAGDQPATAGEPTGEQS